MDGFNKMFPDSFVEQEVVDRYFGKRIDGTNKGTGFLGELKMRDGSGNIMTEFSAGFEFDGNEVEMPLIVPTLSQEEVDYLLDGNKPTDAIYDKAYEHGVERLKKRQSPFANDGKGDDA